MRLAAGRLGVYLARVDLKAGTADVFRVALADGDAAIGLEVRETAEERPDSAGGPAVEDRRRADFGGQYGLSDADLARPLGAFRAAGRGRSERLPRRTGQCAGRGGRRAADARRVLLRCSAVPGGCTGRGERFGALRGICGEIRPGTCCGRCRRGCCRRAATLDRPRGARRTGGQPRGLRHDGACACGGFDPEAVSLSALNLTLDSVYNRGGDIVLRIERLDFAERSRAGRAFGLGTVREGRRGRVAGELPSRHGFVADRRRRAGGPRGARTGSRSGDQGCAPRRSLDSGHAAAVPCSGGAGRPRGEPVADGRRDIGRPAPDRAGALRARAWRPAGGRQGEEPARKGGRRPFRSVSRGISANWSFSKRCCPTRRCAAAWRFPRG